MSCRRVQRLFLGDSERRRSPREERAVVSHLRECPTCRRLRDAGARFEAAVRSLPDQASVSRQCLRQTAIERWIAERETRISHRQVVTAFVSLATTGLALLLVLALLGIESRRLAPPQASRIAGRPKRSPSAPAVPMSAPNATQRDVRTEMAGVPAAGSAIDPRPAADAMVAPTIRSASPVGRPALRPATHPIDDLTQVNQPPETAIRQWTTLSRDEWERMEARVRRVVQVKDDFVQIPFPRLVDASGTQIADAVESYKREAAVVDPRLSREVTLAFKAVALSDVCDRLHAETVIRLEAGRSVADEKVTLFCEKMPLREVMRQLARPFGYTWLRSGKAGEYRYELVQDLRSQLLEEELRNRDRNAALLALDAEMHRYRKYLGLSPDEALARAQTASPEEKKLLERLGGPGWGLIQSYFRLSGNDLALLRAGQQVTFSVEPKPDQQLLPADLARGVLQSQRDRRILLRDGSLRLGQRNGPEGLPPAAVPEARAMLMLTIRQSELGQFTFGGGPGIFISANSPTPGTFFVFGGADALGVGMSPAVLNPRNGVANARWARDPALRPRVTVRSQASCQLTPEMPRAGGDGGPGQLDATQAPEPKVTTADVLEALHRATGLPIVADYYTRLYSPQEVSVQALPLFEALNRLADAMHLRWSRDGVWVQFRSTSFFHDRLKEVPNRLLVRWASSRREHGALTLDDLIEIGQLSDAQLDATGMAEGVRACFGLAEWVLPRRKHIRAQVRYLAEFTPTQRQQAQTPAGLPFSQMTLVQQQGYLSRALYRDAKVRLEELTDAALYVDYTLPGWFRWSPPGRACRPSPAQERTPAAALLAARRIDPQASENQIVPTRLDLTFLYTPKPDLLRLVRSTDDGWLGPSELKP